MPLSATHIQMLLSIVDDCIGRRPMLPGNAVLIKCMKTAPSDHGSNHQLLLNWVNSEPHGDRSGLLTPIPADFDELCFTVVQRC